MKTETAATQFTPTLSGIENSSILRECMGITAEDVESARDMLLEDQKAQEGESRVVGKMTPTEQTIFVTICKLTKKARSLDEKLDGFDSPIFFFALRGISKEKLEVKKSQLKEHNETMEKIDFLRNLMWSIVEDRFSKEMESVEASGLRVTPDFEIATFKKKEGAEPCPRCGGYHE